MIVVSIYYFIISRPQARCIFIQFGRQIYASHKVPDLLSIATLLPSPKISDPREVGY